MHVVFINRFYYPDNSATAQMLRDLATHLAKNNHRVSVITSRQTYDNQQALARHETFEGVDIIRIPGTQFGRSSNLFRFLDTVFFHLLVIPYLLRLKSLNTILVSKTDPPLIHIVVQAIARLKGIPSVVWLQDVYPELLDKLSCKIPNVPYKVLLSIRNRSLRRAQAIVVLGDQMHEHVKSLSLASADVQQIPNWSPSDSIHQVTREQNSLLEKYNPDNKFMVLYSGNLGMAHDHETLLSAAIELEKHAHVQFVFVGSGSGMAQLRSECTRLGLSNVSFHAHQPLDMVSSSLSCADASLVTLLPGINKYLYPSKLYGTLAIGKPVLFIGDKDCDIARELLDNDAGLHIENGQTAKLVDTILSLSKDANRQREIGNNAARLYEQKFRYGKSLSAWELLLTDIHRARYSA